MPTSRGRNHDEHASGTMPRRANTKPNLAAVAGQADVHRQRHRDADADGRPVDRGDDRLGALEDPQRHQAAAVARHARRRSARRCRRRRTSRRRCDRSAPAQNAATGTGDDDGAHVVVGVDPIERVDHLVHHRAGERVQLVGPVQRDGGDVVVDVVEDLRVVHRGTYAACSRVTVTARLELPDGEHQSSNAIR